MLAKPFGEVGVLIPSTRMATRTKWYTLSPDSLTVDYRRVKGDTQMIEVSSVDNRDSEVIKGLEVQRGIV